MKKNTAQQEQMIVSKMIDIYCRHHHKTKELCSDCTKLSQYTQTRMDKCPFQETKTFCSSCKVHCYNDEMRNKIRTVMRFSGPRMLFYHPIIAVRHAVDTIKAKRNANK